MSKAAGPTIFLVVTHGFAVRYLLQTEVLPTLTAGGARVVVLAPNADDGHLRAAIGGPRWRWSGWNPLPARPTSSPPASSSGSTPSALRRRRPGRPDLA